MNCEIGRAQRIYFAILLLKSLCRDVKLASLSLFRSHFGRVVLSYPINQICIRKTVVFEFSSAVFSWIGSKDTCYGLNGSLNVHAKYILMYLTGLFIVFRSQYYWRSGRNDFWPLVDDNHTKRYYFFDYCSFGPVMKTCCHFLVRLFSLEKCPTLNKFSAFKSTHKRTKNKYS